MEIAVIGAGRNGGNRARRLAQAGHSFSLSFTRDAAALEALAGELGAAVRSPADAVAAADAVVVSVPWGAIPEALAQAGSLAAQIEIDTTNHFGSGLMPAPGKRRPPSTPPACRARATRRRPIPDTPNCGDVAR